MLAGNGFYAIQALRTDRQTGTYSERNTTEAAIRREKQGNSAVKRSANYVRYRGASSSEDGSSSPSSISATAEDEPPKNRIQYSPVLMAKATDVTEV
jgi:hypothetical protein